MSFVYRYKRFYPIRSMHIKMLLVHFSVIAIGTNGSIHGEVNRNASNKKIIEIPDCTGFRKDMAMTNIQCDGENNGVRISDELIRYLKLNKINYQYISLPIPAVWPIEGKPVAYFFSFKGKGLNTGVPSHELSVSSSAVVMECYSDSQVKFYLKEMEMVTLGKEVSRIPELKDSIFSITVAVFHRMIACNEQGKEDIGELRKVYQAWISTFPKRSEFVKKYCPAFIDWVLDKKAGVNFDPTNDSPRYFKQMGIVVK